MRLLLEGEMVPMPRLYPPEFRQRAPGLVRSGRPVPGVATLLGIAVSWLVEQAPEYVALAQVRSLVLRAITD